MLDDDESLADYGCDDVEAHIAECEEAHLHMIDIDVDGSCCNCGHKSLGK
jgi:hypothetical protein